MEAIWASPRKGWPRWIGSVNHSDLGLRFIYTSAFFFAVGGLLAMLIRAQLASPDSQFAGPEVYNQIFTMHGTIMMFLFAIPMLEGLAIYLLPKLLGSRDLAFPRITALGYWCYALGGAMLLIAMLAGVAPDGGWFMYTPLSNREWTPGVNADVWLLGITFVEISAIAAAVELTVSVLKVRAPGMALDRMPLFGWYILAMALMMIGGFPPLILGSVLLEVERAFDWPFFDAARGGDPLLWQHLFWLFGHPEVYIIFLPAAGIVSTVLPVMARTRILGYGWIVAAIAALAFLSFGLWVHHMFTVGIPHMALAFFSAASLLVAIPSGIQIFAWLGTLWQGRPEMKLPMLYLIGFFLTFVMGGLSGVMVAVVPFNWQAHDTAFVTAHLHYVLMGGFVFPILAGAYYWLPHVTGRQRSFKLGVLGFWLIFVGFNLAFFTMHWLGLLGQPRRIETYDWGLGWAGWNLLSSVGGFLLAIGFALFFVDIVLEGLLGRRVMRNPWRSGTLEWAMLLPAPAYNFASVPHVRSREPLDDQPDLALEIARGEHHLAAPRHGWRETAGVDMMSGRLTEILVLPGNSRAPFFLALVIGLAFNAMLFRQYWLVPLILIGVVALIWRWVAATGSREDLGPLDAGRGVAVPLASEAGRSINWWGNLFTLAANLTFFGSMLFGYAFLSVVAPGWPPPRWIDASWTDLVAGLAGAGGGLWFSTKLASGVRREGAAAARPWLGLGGLSLVLLALPLLAATLGRLPPPTGHAYAAIAHVMAAYGLFHVAVALVMTLFVHLRIGQGYVSAARSGDVRVLKLWQDYAAITGAIVLMALHLPRLVA